MTIKETVENRNRFCTGNRIIRAERTIRITLNASVRISLIDGGSSPVILYICKRCTAAVRLVDGYNHLCKFRTGNLSIRSERTIRISLHIAGFNHGVNHTIVPAATNVDKVRSRRIGSIQFSEACKHGCRFCTGDASIRAESSVFVTEDIRHRNTRYSILR